MEYLNFISKTVATLSIFTLLSVPAQAASNDVAFILLNDTSGVQTDLERIPDLRMQLLAQYKDLRKAGREYAKAEFVLLSTSLARPVFYGKVSDLSSSRANEIIEKSINMPDHCNQLAASFSAIRNTVIQLSGQGFSEIHISVFSSLIDTPVPCNDIEVTLPQLPLPINWLTTFVPTGNVASVTFYAVNAHQHPVYAQAMAPLAEWARVNDKSFAIHDMESSVNVLRFGLSGVER